MTVHDLSLLLEKADYKLPVKVAIDGKVDNVLEIKDISIQYNIGGDYDLPEQVIVYLNTTNAVEEVESDAE